MKTRHLGQLLAVLFMAMILCSAAAQEEEGGEKGGKKGAKKPGQKKELAPESYGLRVSFGMKDPRPSTWNVSLKADECQITNMVGLYFDKTDSVNLVNFSWKCKTHPRNLTSAQKKDDSIPRVFPIGVDVFVTGKPDRQMEIDASPHASMAFELRELAYSRPIEHEGKKMTVERVPLPIDLTSKGTEGDFASIAAGRAGPRGARRGEREEVEERKVQARLGRAGGGAWASWIEYGAKGQKLVLANLSGGQVGEIREVTKESGRFFAPMTAIDEGGRIWVIFGMEVNGNVDIYARNLNAETWMPMDRLSEHPGPDINPSMCIDDKEQIWVVWQSARDGNYDIFMRQVRDATWSPEYRVTKTPENEWSPAICVDKYDTAFIAYDVYRDGDYDVAMKKFANGEFTDASYVAQTSMNETHVSLACDPKNRVWAAWEEGPGNWGKEYPSENGAPLHAERTIKYKVIDSEGIVGAGDIFEKLPLDLKGDNEKPRLAVDAQGRAWMAFRHLRGAFEERSSGEAGPVPLWENYLIFCVNKGWETPVPLPRSAGRQDQIPSLSADRAGNVWLAWSEDGRDPWQDEVVPVRCKVHAAVVNLPKDMTEPELAALEEGTPKAMPISSVGSHYCIRIGQKEYSLLFGDLNRQTEMSVEARAAWGAYDDLFRYAIDAAGLDFVGVADDFGDAGRPLRWRRAQDDVREYAIPKRFVPFFGQWRTPHFPVGHRLVIAEAPTLSPVGIFYSEPRAKKIAEDDTKRLWEALKKESEKVRCVTIPTTPASKWGTDWSDADPSIEPVVEIYSGAHWSYEQEGAPLSAEHGAKTIFEGFQPEGFVAKAIEKKIKLGFVGGSGPCSAGRAFTGVYAEEATPKSIFDAIMARRTYAATDKIILKYRVGDHFMGEEFSVSEKPTFEIRAIGTDEIKEIAVIKDNKTIHTADPEGNDITYSFSDENAEPGKEACYYVRVIQDNGEMAWGSPVWITVK